MKRVLLLLLLLGLLAAACGGGSSVAIEASMIPEPTPTAPQIPQEVEADIANWSEVNHYWSYAGSGNDSQGPLGEIEVWDLNGNSVQVDIDWASTQINIHAVDSAGKKIDYSVHDQTEGQIEPFEGVLVYYYYDQYDIYFQVFWDPAQCGPTDNPHPYEE